MRSTELILHPVRLRVVQALSGRRDLTTAQLGELMPDVPVATLYRHVSTLLEGGVLRVIDERRARGTVERTYRLVTETASVDVDELRGMTADEHRRGFHAFVAGLLARFDRYLEASADAGGRVDPVADRLSYREAALHLSDAELDQMIAELSSVLARYQDHPAGPGRARRTLTTVLLRE